MTKAYPFLDAKAAARLHSLARNHALIDGDKQLGLAAVIAFCGLNGRRLTLTNDQAYDPVMKVAAGELDQVEEISAILQGATAPRHQDARTSIRKPRVRLDRCSAAMPASLRSGARKVPIVLTLALLTRIRRA